MKFYRYHAAHYNDGQTVIDQQVFDLVRTTPCGHWIDVYGEEKWVSKHSVKRFAYPTKKLAMESLVARKKRQLVILTDQVRRVKKIVEYLTPENAKKEMKPRTLVSDSIDWLA